jgi:PPOX class probable FMN-dependent enzyme
MKIKTTDQLRDIYGPPGERASKKVLNTLEPHSINFIETSSFLLLATYSSDGKLDVSPRGGNQGFVKVLAQNRIVIPNFKGNNRLDSLINIVETGRIGTIFLIPGVDETLRVNGKAYITTDQELLTLYQHEKKLPKTYLVLEVEEVFLHCAKALMRSRLWDSEKQIDRSGFPTMSQMINDQLNSKEAPESQEEMIKRYLEEL